MTTQQLKKAIGKVLRIDTGSGLEVNVRVVNVKEGWGKPRLLVTPLAGSGEAWIEISRVREVITPGLVSNTALTPCLPIYDLWA